MEELSATLKSLPTGYLKALLLNGVSISLVYYIVWKRYGQQLAAWRIQLKNRVDKRQLVREIKNGLITLLVGTLFSGVVFYLSLKGHTKIYLRFSEHHPFFSLAGFFVLLLIDDTWFYWCHRLLHHPKLFRYIHAEHHKNIDVNPFTSMSFHFIEPALLSFWIFPVSFLFPIYAPMLALVQLWGLLDNIKSHLGYEFYPAWFNKSWLRFLTSSTHHNMHHQRFNGNYGVHFRIWDRMLGTEFSDYEREFDGIHVRKNLTKQTSKR